MTTFDRIRGAVWDGSRLFVTDELERRGPEPGEVIVDLDASGICHSDLNVIDGTSPLAPPVVLGHEGAGRVARLGEGVTGWAVGDRVAICTLTPCRRCARCLAERFTECATAFGTGARPFRWRGEPVRSYANCSSFASSIVVDQKQLVRTGAIPAEHAALLGCAVSTGYGVAANVAGIGPGSRVAVFGIGGIGVNVLQAARILGATEIVAVDIDPDRATTARAFGATDFVLVDRTDTAAAITERVRTTHQAGFDATIECSGAPAAIEASVDLLDRGGVAAAVGIPPRGARIPVDIGAMLSGKRIVGSYNGAIHPDRDLAELVHLTETGRLDLAGQVSAVWPLERIADAIEAVRAGRVIRAVVSHAS